jgi:anti-sigma regulatory factor (Ser/Thr protein kinase)
MVAAPPERTELLRRGLTAAGVGDRVEEVAFVGPPAAVARRRAGPSSRISDGEGPASPAAVVAAYRHLFDGHLRQGATRLRLVGEVEPGLGPAEHLAWAQYEAAVGAAFDSTPVTIVCPYHLEVLPPAFVHRVRDAHRDTWGEGGGPNDGYAGPASVLRSLRTGPMPVEGFPPALDLRIGPEVSIPREALRRVAGRAGLGPDRLDDLVLAFTEVATNALVHGSSVARAKVWASNGTVVCTITDSGPGIDDPLVGLLPPSPGNELDPGGLGLWVARQLCDALDLIQGPEGMTVRLVVRR